VIFVSTDFILVFQIPLLNDKIQVHTNHQKYAHTGVWPRTVYFILSHTVYGCHYISAYSKIKMANVIKCEWV